MNSDIGSKIRTLRKAMRLTQTQLAGDRITRNMLSLIENGDASPSIATLEYIAERLGVSPAYFFMSKPMREQNKEADKLGDIRALYHAKEYAKCLSQIEQFYQKRESKDIPDEFLLLAAECALVIGKQYTLRGAFESANVHLAKAHEYCRLCSYNTEWIDATAFLFEAVIENSDNPLQALDKAYFSAKRRSVGEETYCYLTLLRASEESGADTVRTLLPFIPLLERAHKEHITAKCDLCSTEEETRNAGLSFLCGMIKKASDYPLDTITKYLILRDIEYGMRTQGNFEKAYRYASMRLKIITDMRD